MTAFPSHPWPARMVLATGNAHKLTEMRAIARAHDCPSEILSAQAVGGMPRVVEDAGTFRGNALKKARALKACLPPEAWVLSDDSGLCVDALEGAPGVESAYYAGMEATAAENLAKLVAVMKDVPTGRRGATFVCVLVLLGPHGFERVAEGHCEGSLLIEPLGPHGFGYDPLFIPLGEKLSFAELPETSKNALSHRARAWASMAEGMRVNQEGG